MTHHRANTFSFRSYQQLPRFRLGPLKGFLSCHSDLQGPSNHLLCCFLGTTEKGDINPRNLLLDSRYKTPPRIGLDWLNKNANDGLAKKQISRPISRKDYFCGLSKEEIKRKSIWRPKDRVNSHDRESLKTALPYR